MRNHLKRWPTALALVLTIDNLIDPGPLAPLTLLVLALAYLSIGLVRGTLKPPAIRNLQLAGAAFYLGLIVLATLLPAPASHVVVGVGWLAHAGWDLWHYRRNLVVWREFAEWCAVVDAVIGISVLAWVFA